MISLETAVIWCVLSFFIGGGLSAIGLSLCVLARQSTEIEEELLQPRTTKGVEK